MARLLLAAAVAATATASEKWLSIESFGAIPWDNSTAAAQNNGVAIFNAFAAANVGFNNTRTVWVPPNRNYTVLPHAPLLNLNDVTLRIDGVLQADVADRSIWPNNTAFSLDSTALDLLSFGNSTGITITGSGVVDGDGYDWWWQCLLGGPDNRPNLVGARGVSGIVINGSVLFKNSPSFHFYLYDVTDVTIHGITIWVDVDAQKEMLVRATAAGRPHAAPCIATASANHRLHPFRTPAALCCAVLRCAALCCSALAGQDRPADDGLQVVA